MKNIVLSLVVLYLCIGIAWISYDFVTDIIEKKRSKRSENMINADDLLSRLHEQIERNTIIGSDTDDILSDPCLFCVNRQLNDFVDLVNEIKHYEAAKRKGEISC